MTDCYIGLDCGDQCIGRLQSPDTWLQWEISGKSVDCGCANSFDSSNKNHPQQRVESYGSCDFGGSSNSCRTNPDYYYNHLKGTPSTDDIIFLNCLLQDDDLSCLPSDKDSTSMDFQSISRDTDALGLAYVPKFGLSKNSDQNHCPSVKVLETKDMVSSDQEASFGTSEVNDYPSSHEESVLMRLEAVLNQFNGNMRLSLRDSLYRLAKNSEQESSNIDQVEKFLDKSSLPDISSVCSRSRTNTTESAANTIDRAVSYLMFSKVHADEQDHIPPSSPVFVA